MTVLTRASALKHLSEVQAYYEYMRLSDGTDKCIYQRLGESMRLHLSEVAKRLGTYGISALEYKCALIAYAHKPISLSA